MARPATMFALGLVLSGAAAAVVLARPEPTPANLEPPARSAASLAPAIAEPSENSEAAADPDQTDEPAPVNKGYALTRQDLDQALSRVHGRAMDCHSDNPPPVVMVHIVIAPTGAVASIGLPNDVRGTPAGDCIARAMRGMSFPAWRSPPNVPNVEWNYPLRYDAE